MLILSVRDRLGKEDVEHVVTTRLPTKGRCPLTPRVVRSLRLPVVRRPRLRHTCNARVEGALTHGVSMPVMISLGAHGMEAIAQPPTTFRLTPRPYQYEAVAALLAATARGVQRPLLVLPTGTGKTI